MPTSVDLFGRLAAGMGKYLVMAGLVLALAMVSGNNSQAGAGEHVRQAVKYMQKVASDMMAAQRRGTPESFARAIKRHADVQAIAMYSLGRYRGSLPPAKRGAYYRGVREFMARYFANQSRKYRIVKAEIGADARVSGEAVLVDTKVWLKSGATYKIVWRLVKRRGRYRVSDVSVLGFSLAFLQRGIFYRFLQKKSGDVNALVAALNR